MTEVLKTLLFLNLQGSIIVILLLVLKSIILKSFSGKAQRSVWIFAAVVFLLPVWKILPENIAAPIIIPYYTSEVTYMENEYTTEVVTNRANVVEQNVRMIKLRDVLFYTWVAGAFLYLMLNICGYIIFLAKKRKESGEVYDAEFFELLTNMQINYKIKLKQCNDVDSPMLTGIFFPVVYIPEEQQVEQALEYVYRHELTHYKHKDLYLKWIICIINAINWFNPLIYFVVKNFNIACEIYCDETVTRGMDDEEKKAYMNTILNLIVRK